MYTLIFFLFLTISTCLSRCELRTKTQLNIKQNYFCLENTKIEPCFRSPTTLFRIGCIYELYIWSKGLKEYDK